MSLLWVMWLSIFTSYLKLDFSNIFQDMENKTEDFKPLGAIAFFVALLILAAVIWFGIYFLMISQV